MTKRIIGLVVAAVAVLGVAGVAFAATAATSSPQAASYDLEEAALALAADPAPAPGDPAAPAQGKGHELQACVKPKVDAGADRKAAVKECAVQLGIRAGGRGKGGKGGGPGGKPGRLGRAAHAELVVPKADGQWETIIVDRGKVTVASVDSISVQRPDGPTVTLKVVAGTKVRGAASVAELTAGREVVVVSAGGEARSVVAHR